MNRVACIAVCGVFLSLSYAYARTELGSVDSSPVNVITSTEIQQTSMRSISDIVNAVPTPADQNVQQQDINLAGLNVKNTLVLLNGRRLNKRQEGELGGFLSPDAQSIPQEMIDRIEVLKDGSSSVYGSDAIQGVVNIITKTPVHPKDLPEPSAFTPQENQWLTDGIPIGKIGIQPQGGRYDYGLSTYTKKGWDWTPGRSLGSTYGLQGPVIGLSKTDQGPVYSIYNDDGAWVGDVTKPKVAYNPGVTAQYLLRAEYPGLNPYYTAADRAYSPDKLNPYGAIVLQSGRRMGDLFQTGDILNSRLTNFKDYDDGLHALDGGCVPPYAAEPVFGRTVLKKKAAAPEVAIVPNDPLYQQAKAKKKSLVGGLVGGLVNVGAGVLGGGGAGLAVDDDEKGPKVFDQYSLKQIGYLPKFDPKSAWNMVDAESKNVVVAVIDSGLDMQHPDRPEYIWTNDKEIPGNGKDDDGNGYVDDVNGWNFLDENADVRDFRGHGTIVAGIIAARTNNGQGIAGINPGAVIMPLKVADKFGNTNSLSIFRAIKYAVKHGAKVINISLGARGVSELERLAINFAHASGVTVVVASGNEGEDIGLHGPASVGYALAVGAMNVDGTRATVSNMGPNNALMAPGEKIFSLHSKDARWEGPAGMKEHLYTSASGTSFAAPMVAATASLLLAKDPKLTPAQIEDILASTAHKTSMEFWNSRTGAGVIDAARALSSLEEDHFNVKITAVKVAYKDKAKNVEAVDVYGTVRGKVASFTVEVGKGKNARSFKPVIGLAGQQADDDLVAHIAPAHLRGSNDWEIIIRAKDTAGKEYVALTALQLK